MGNEDGGHEKAESQITLSEAAPGMELIAGLFPVALCKLRVFPWSSPLPWFTQRMTPI
jgi:hypothetical protein